MQTIEERLSRRIQSLATDLLVARYRSLADLSASDLGVLRQIEAKAKNIYRADTRIMSEGSEIRAPQVIVSGWACYQRELADGRRQIMSLLVPGDAIGVCQLSQPVAQTTLMALSNVRTVEAPELSAAWQDRSRSSGLARALDMAAAEETHFLFCHTMRLGRQTAYERMANLFTELEYRLSGRGLSQGGRFPFPLTQETLADAVGLSVVHVNRTLQLMRRENRIDLARGVLTIREPETLRAAGEFQPPRVSAAVAQPGL